MIPRFNDRSTDSFHLWKLRMEASLETINCLDIVEGTIERPTDNSDVSNTQAMFDKRSKRAASIIITSLGDKPLMTVQMHSKSPRMMWQTLCTRYASNTTSNKLSLITEAFLKKKLRHETMSDHIAALETTFTKLKNAGQSIDKLIQIAILLASIRNETEYDAVIAAIRTMDEANSSWAKVTTRLVDEYKEKHIGHNYNREKTENLESISAAVMHRRTSSECEFCKKRGHTANVCWENPKGSSYRIKHRRTPNKSKPRLALTRACISTAMKTRETPLMTKEQGPDMPTIAFGYANQSTGYKSETFILDTGATHHMCSNRSLFREIKEVPEYKVTLGDNSQVSGTLIGEIDLILTDKDKSNELTGTWIRLTKVLFIAEMGLNLLSMSRLDDNGIHATFGNNKFQIKEGVENTQLGTGFKSPDGLYELYASVQKPFKVKLNMLRKDGVQGMELWHRRLGHASKSVIEDIRRNKVVEGIDLNQSSTLIDCLPCSNGKQTNAPYKGKLASNDMEVGDVIYSDICGPMPNESWSRKKYFISFIDGRSKYLTVETMLTKTGEEALKLLKIFKAKFERQFNRTLKRIHTDNGGEYRNQEMNLYCRNEGIIHTTTAPYNPQSNGMAERMNRTLMMKVRSMLSEAGLGHRFWAEALNHAAYIQNVMSNSSSRKSSPLECISGKRPDISNLKIFGCLVHTTIPKKYRKKLDSRVWTMIYVGHSGKHLVRAFRPNDMSIHLCRHAKFDETVFPGFRENAEEQSYTAVSKPTSSIINSTLTTDIENYVEISTSDTEKEDNVNSAVQLDQGTASPLRLRMDLNAASIRAGNEEISNEQNTVVERRYPSRIRKTVNYQLTVKANLPDEPTLKVALSSQDSNNWISAIHAELSELRERETWVLVPYPRSARVLPCKVVLKVKRNTDGSIEKYKARIVALGCMQKANDHGETFSPGIDFTTIRIALAIAVWNRAYVHQMDVTGAFLYGRLKEEIYMSQPKGFEEEGKEDYVCQLKKSIYGLKQAPRVWYNHLKHCLSDIGFSPLLHSDCAFRMRKGNSQIIILIYVDDMLLITIDKTLLKETKSELMKSFKVKDLGQVDHFLGVNISYKDDCISLSQSHYTKKILELHGMQDCKSASSPMDPGQYSELTVKRPSTDSENFDMQRVPYREAIGQLLYISTRTRPDISVAVGVLSRNVANPKPVHWIGVKRIFRYLKGTLNYELVLRPDDDILIGHADSDWAGSSDRVSITGNVAQIGGSTVYWRSAQQKCIALSSTEAEYVSLSEIAREITWLRNLLSEFGVAQRLPTVITQDNTGAIDWSSDIGQFKKNKHIDIRLHHVRNLIRSNTITLQQVPTRDMIADVLTKPVNGTRLKNNTRALGVKDCTYERMEMTTT